MPRRTTNWRSMQKLVSPLVALTRSPISPRARPLFGRPEFELNLDGAVWRFSNEGNRGAFEKHPEVYAPRFAGLRSGSYWPRPFGTGSSPFLGRWSASGFISSIASRRAPPSLPIPAASSIRQSASGQTLRAVWGSDRKLRQTPPAAALPASPHAMNAGTRKFSAARP